LDSIIASNNADYLIIWVFFTLLIGIGLAIDFGIIGKIQHMFRTRNTSENNNNGSNQKREISSVLSVKKSPQQKRQQTVKRAFEWTIIWISLAAVFAAIIYLTLGYEETLLFVTGYAIEKSLSVDNMFIFLIIFSSLAIPHVYQHKVLMAGILSAIIMRIALILAGVSLLESFHWMIYIFGGLLLFTAIRMLMQKKEEQDKKKMAIEKNIAVRVMKKFVPISFELNNDKFLLRKNNSHKVLYATPMLVPLVIVEMTDLVFALDSIPAILATMILFFIGCKMIVSEFFEIPIAVSLTVIFGYLPPRYYCLSLEFVNSKLKWLLINSINI
jgi:tellurite resistance protein TerC